MERLDNVTAKKRLAHRVFRVLAVILAVALLLSDAANMGKAQAQGSVTEIANVVVFVKYANDTRDIFNATNGEGSSSPYYRSNWQEIKKMYDLDQDSFKNYISTVTEGKVHVTNYFPQELPGGQGVQPLILSGNNPDGNGMVDEILKALTDGRIPTDAFKGKLDNRQTGILDNLTIIVQGSTVEGGDTAIHKTYAGTGSFNGIRIRDYNMIPSDKMVSADAGIHVLMQQGVIAHEFLHSLGLPDLYRQSGSDVPVGQWDIMANVSCYLQYPLSYLRARQGWIPMGTITQSGTYTLTAVSESGGNKVFVLRTPLSDTELICLEYRRKSSDPNQFEYSIPSSGLLMYRVDNKVADLTNIAGKDYIYVYRPGTATHDANAVRQAALDVSAGETSYGSTDLTADYTQNTLYYSDGTNSGIRLSDLKLSPDQKQLTFTVTFANYDSSGVWDKLEEDISGQFSEDPDICIDPVTGTLYAAYTEEVPGSYNNATRVRVMRWSGTSWQQVGQTVDNAWMPSLAVCGGEVYLSYCPKSWDSVIYCRLAGNTWGQVASYPAQYSRNMQFIVDGDEIYGAFQKTDASNNMRLVIYDLKGGRTVTDSLTAMDFSNPALVKSGNSFYMVYAAYGSAAQILEYNLASGVWSTAYTFPVTSTNTHDMVKQGQKIYAFAGCTGQGAYVATFDGNGWSSSPVISMNQFYSVSMETVREQVYLAYYDTAAKKARLLRGNGAIMEECNDRLGSGLDFLKLCSHGDTLYAAVRAENTGTMVVRRKVVEGAGRLPKFNPPEC